MMDREVIFEGLSSLLGVTVLPLSDKDKREKSVFSKVQGTSVHGASHPTDPALLTVENVLSTIWFQSTRYMTLDQARFGQTQTETGEDGIASTLSPTKLNYGGNQALELNLIKKLDDGVCQKFYPPMFLQTESKAADIQEQLFIDEDTFFDKTYDYDFTNMTDSSVFMRGDETYTRPCGWSRIALKVKGKYEDGDVWLGPIGRGTNSAPGEWPVSYHGTSIDNTNDIISEGFKPGPRELYGRGIYSTPDINVAACYAKRFKSKVNGKSYIVAMQNRINPKYRKIFKHKENPPQLYYLVPVPDGKTSQEERKIVDRSIRPYGLLFKEIQYPSCSLI